ncbi:unnamed protein product [Pocillopora meandrina]|uniref:Uncharacterized protein n=1 Tax=Pocillopora meandrina TaxID=46732 RepID=A0AAU9Y281_9CNID|nr:unnamed protein product [Pocillopora meandrina]
MISETEKKLKQLRDKNDVVFKRWHAYAVEISSELGTEPSAPRTASRQQHRANAPHDTAEEYYRRNLYIPFLDHITQEMNRNFFFRFGSTQKTAMQLLRLMPSTTVACTNACDPNIFPNIHICCCE